MLSPPRVERAEILVRRGPDGRPTEVQLRFRFVACARPRFHNPIEENIWRVRVGALRMDGSSDPAVLLLDRVRHGNFAPEPQAPGWHSHVWSLAGEPSSLIDDVATYLCEEGRRAHGTSMWFEDVVGHVAIADELVVATEPG